METRDEVPQEVKCFICFKPLQEAEIKVAVLVIEFEHMVGLKRIAVCEEDLKWIKENPDAASAICQSRFDAHVKRQDQDTDS